MKSIGIDIGTSTISFAVTDSRKMTEEYSCTIVNSSRIRTSHAWEQLQDPDRITSLVRTQLDRLLQQFDDIICIGISSQMHGIVYTDRTGRAVSPLYTWQDGRGNLPVFNGETLCSLLESEFGIRVSSGYGLVTHLFNLKKQLLPSCAVSLCTIGDYVCMDLTGTSAPLTHISQAAGMGFFDLENLCFKESSVSSVGIDPSVLPSVVKDFTIAGTYRNIPVSISVGDNQAGFLGCVNQPGTVLINIGTGSQVSAETDTFLQIPGIETRPLTASSYLLVGAAVCGGSAYSMLEQFFREYASAAGAPDLPQYDVMNRILADAPDPGNRWKVRTTFAGSREHPDETGCITGITPGNFHPASMIFGILGGMAEELHELYRLILDGTGNGADEFKASGNAVRRNPFLKAMLEKEFGRSITVEQNEEEAALGAAGTALKALGISSPEQDIHPSAL